MYERGLTSLIFYGDKMANGWIKTKEDLDIFDRYVYDMMNKWCPNKGFAFYITEIIGLYERLYI